MFGKNRKNQGNTRTVTYYTPGGKYDIIAKDILDSPHTLIAGTTGCGKSTFIHSVMRAFLVHYAPVTGRLILIDPKRVELSEYAVLPHTIRTEKTAEGARAALYQAIAIMEDRYRTMEARGEKRHAGAEIFIIIDELADLMLSAYAVEIKKQLQRILQLGRAAGIHVIAATQCPNRKVIPAELVCNFTNRLGLRCLSAIESRQIIGVRGCELLPEHGQGYYIHGCNIDLYNLPFVKDEDIKPLLRYWTSPACRVA